MANNSKQCNITNNSGWDVVVALAVIAGEGNNSNAVVAANGQLEILKTSGGTVIKNGSSDAITLDRNYKAGSGESEAVTFYDLQVCDGNWLYPVANIPVEQQSGNGTGFGTQNVSKEGGVQMALAADFYQTIMAYPDSQLADDYTTALQAAKDAAFTKADGSADAATAAAGALEDRMAAFFKNTDKYEPVKLADVVTIDNYYNNFPAVWAQYKDSMTYYLYGSDGETASFTGTLSLQKSGSIDATKAAGGYTCSFIPAINGNDTSKTDVDASNAVNLSYVAGCFTDDPKAASPTIALKGSFMLKRLFTTVATDNSLLSVITGVVNETPCVGFDTPQPAAQPVEVQLRKAKLSQTSFPSIEQCWDTLIHPKTQYELLISLLTLAGAVLLIPAVGSAVYGLYRVIKFKIAEREALSMRIVEYTWKDLKTREITGLDNEPTKIRKDLGDFYTKFNPKDIKGYKNEIQNVMQAQKLIDAFVKITESLAVMQRYSYFFKDMVDRVQAQFDAVDKSVTNLQTCGRTDLEKVLPEELANFTAVHRQVKFIYNTVNGRIEEKESRDIIEDFITASSELFDQIEKARTEEKNEEKERDPELVDKLIPELETV